MKKPYGYKDFLKFKNSIESKISLNELSNVFSEERDEKITLHKKITIYKKTIRDKVVDAYLIKLLNIKEISDKYQISEKEVNKILIQTGIM